MAARYRVERTTTIEGVAKFLVIDDEVGTQAIAEFDDEQAARARCRELETDFQESDAQAPEVDLAPRTDADK